MNLTLKAMEIGAIHVEQCGCNPDSKEIERVNGFNAKQIIDCFHFLCGEISNE